MKTTSSKLKAPCGVKLYPLTLDQLLDSLLNMSFTLHPPADSGEQFIVTLEPPLEDEVESSRSLTAAELHRISEGLLSDIDPILRDAFGLSRQGKPPWGIPELKALRTSAQALITQGNPA